MKFAKNYKQLSVFLECIDCPVIWLSPNYTIMGINQLALSIYGWKKQDVLKENFSSLLKKNRVKNPIPADFSFTVSRYCTQEIEAFIGKKRQKIAIKWKIKPFVDDDNILQGVVLTGHNIVLQRKLEDRVYELDSIVAQMPGNVYWYDRNFKYLGCNENSAKTLGMSRRQAIGKSLKLIIESIKGVSEDAKQRLIQDGLDVIRTKIAKLNIEEPPFKSENGEITYMIANKVPLFNKKRELYGVIGISADISNLKKMEEDLRKAKEQAEAANKAKGEFLANMSHDVKTPLSGMIAISELLKSRVQEQYRDLVLDVMEAGRNLMTFFDNCIELSKLENGSVILIEESFSLKQLLNEIIQLFQPAIEAKGLAMHIEYSEKIPNFLVGNRIDLYRVLLNLMGNAIKFTAQGSITISAQFSQKSTTEKTVVKLTVSDTGIGIPKEKQSVIFEQFSRVTPSYKGVYEGRGIGLYIVQKFVRAMGGEIYVRSQEDKGSQFTVVVPLKVALLTDAEYEEEINLPQDNLKRAGVHKDISHATWQVGAKKLSNCNILLVEDNLVSRKSACLLLDSLGCHVDVAICGEAAMAIFQSGKYELIIIDIGLPDIDGYQVAKRFREMEEGTSFHVPILGLSAHVTSKENELSTIAGMSGMLPKPLLLDQAVELLKKYCSNYYSET